MLRNLWARSLPIALLMTLLLGAAAPANAHGGEGDLGLEGISVDSLVVNPRDGTVTATGTITCSAELAGIFVGVDLSQVVGRFHTINGSGGTAVDCPAPAAEGEPSIASYSVLVIPWEGKFAGGSAWVSAFADICVETEFDFVCDFASLERTSTRLKAR